MIKPNNCEPSEVLGRLAFCLQKYFAMESVENSNAPRVKLQGAAVVGNAAALIYVCIEYAGK